MNTNMGLHHAGLLSRTGRNACQSIRRRKNAIIFVSAVYTYSYPLTPQGFNIHINGTFHCCLRYKQLHSLNEQLRRSLPTLTLPAFPSKKLLPLTPHQVELRRHAIERYIQLIGQDPVFSKSELLRCFLLSAQQESTFTESRETTVDVFLMNGFRIDVNCYTVECSSKVLAKACHNIDVRPEYASYLALYLMRKERDGGVTLVRRLMDFEAPYISQRLQDECKIVIRKRYESDAMGRMVWRLEWDWIQMTQAKPSF